MALLQTRIRAIARGDPLGTPADRLTNARVTSIWQDPARGRTRPVAERQALWIGPQPSGAATSPWIGPQPSGAATSPRARLSRGTVRVRFRNTLDNVIVKVLASVVYLAEAIGARPKPDTQEVCEMTIVRRTSPFGELVSLRQAMDRLFEDNDVRPIPRTNIDHATRGLALDVTSDTDELVVEAALPGFAPEDVDVTVEDRTLRILAESRTKHSTGEGEALVREIRRGNLSRVINLPTGLEPDKATATFEHGLLTLRIPRAEAVKPRQIRIDPMVDGKSTTIPKKTATPKGDAAKA
jgi:HSP20 family protein